MDPVLTAVAVTLIVAVPFDWYVAVKLIRAAYIRPRYQVLTLAALRSAAIAIAATLAAVLGVQSIWFQVSGGQRLLPTPIPTVIIAAALIIISLPNIYALRWLSAEGEE